MRTQKQHININAIHIKLHIRQIWLSGNNTVKLHSDTNKQVCASNGRITSIQIKPKSRRRSDQDSLSSLCIIYSKIFCFVLVILASSIWWAPSFLLRLRPSDCPKETNRSGARQRKGQPVQSSPAQAIRARQRPTVTLDRHSHAQGLFYQWFIKFKHALKTFLFVYQRK